MVIQRGIQSWDTFPAIPDILTHGSSDAFKLKGQRHSTQVLSQYQDTDSFDPFKLAYARPIAIVNMPMVPKGSSLAGDYSALVTGWYQGQQVNFFKFGLNETTKIPVPELIAHKEVDILDDNFDTLAMVLDNYTSVRSPNTFYLRYEVNDLSEIPTSMDQLSQFDNLTILFDSFFFNYPPAPEPLPNVSTVTTESTETSDFSETSHAAIHLTQWAPLLSAATTTNEKTAAEKNGSASKTVESRAGTVSGTFALTTPASTVDKSTLISIRSVTVVSGAVTATFHPVSAGGLTGVQYTTTGVSSFSSSSEKSEKRLSQVTATAVVTTGSLLSIPRGEYTSAAVSSALHNNAEAGTSKSRETLTTATGEYSSTSAKGSGLGSVLGETTEFRSSMAQETLSQPSNTLPTTVVEIPTGATTLGPTSESTASSASEPARAPPHHEVYLVPSRIRRPHPTTIASASTSESLATVINNHAGATREVYTMTQWAPNAPTTVSAFSASASAVADHPVDYITSRIRKPHPTVTTEHTPEVYPITLWLPDATAEQPASRSGEVYRVTRWVPDTAPTTASPNPTATNEVYKVTEWVPNSETAAATNEVHSGNEWIPNAQASVATSAPTNEVYKVTEWFPNTSGQPTAAASRTNEVYRVTQWVPGAASSSRTNEVYRVTQWLPNAAASASSSQASGSVHTNEVYPVTRWVPDSALANVTLQNYAKATHEVYKPTRWLPYAVGTKTKEVYRVIEWLQDDASTRADQTAIVESAHSEVHLVRGRVRKPRTSTTAKA
ncbi:hypothetical protein HDU84_003710 [Entophlyctis sp. JEL0112]|nr:hypothetical protein HDU84_003710 [Entophlyctis sp. JEL0112]